LRESAGPTQLGRKRTLLPPSERIRKLAHRVDGRGPLRRRARTDIVIHDVDRVRAAPRLTQITVDHRASHAPDGDVTSLRAVVLVEGNSDRVALHTLLA
jgi:hypothetical protein